MQRLSKFSKEWGFTFFGLIVTGFILFFTVYHTYFYASGPGLTSADVQLSNISATPAITESAAKHVPTRLIMPSLDLAVDIDNSTINITTNEWPLSTSRAHYANFTPSLGSARGTMLLYGHNTWEVMRKTADVTIGDQLTLFDDAGQKWDFTMTNEVIIKPEDVGFIYEDVPFRIVIFTCNGWNDEYRRLMYFSPNATL